MNALEKVVASEEIKQLKARYFRYIDTEEWDGFRRDVFHEDVHMDVREALPEPPKDESEAVFDGVDAVVDFLEVAVADTTTIHHGHMPEIEFASGDTAHGVFAVEYIMSPEGGPSAERPGVQGFGYYHDDFEKVDGEWRLKAVSLTPLHERPTS